MGHNEKTLIVETIYCEFVTKPKKKFLTKLKKKTTNCDKTKRKTKKNYKPHNQIFKILKTKTVTNSDCDKIKILKL